VTRDALILVGILMLIGSIVLLTPAGPQGTLEKGSPFLLIEGTPNSTTASLTIHDQSPIQLQNSSGVRTWFTGSAPADNRCSVITVTRQSRLRDDLPYAYTVEDTSIIRQNQTIDLALKDNIHEWGCETTGKAGDRTCRTQKSPFAICGQYPAIDDVSGSAPRCENVWRQNPIIDQQSSLQNDIACVGGSWEPCTREMNDTYTTDNATLHCKSGSTTWEEKRDRSGRTEAWQLIENPISSRNTVHALDLYNSDLGFALAHQPLNTEKRPGTRLYKWDGQTWEDQGVLSDYDLHDVTILDENLAWIVGNNGTILRWDGQTWENISSPTDARLFDISMVSRKAGMIAGGYNLPHSSYSSRDNSRPEDTNATTGRVLYWDGQDWELMDTPDGEHDVFWMDVEMSDMDNAWIAGGGEIIGGEVGRIAQWDGQNWELQSIWPRTDNPTNNDQFPSEPHAISAIDSTTAWVLGDLLYQWDGTAWRRYDWADMPYYHGQRKPGVPEPIYSSTSTDTTIYIGGQVMPIMRWNISTWKVMETQKIRTPTPRDVDAPYYNIIWDISMLNDSYGMAGGAYGKIYEYTGD